MQRVLPDGCIDVICIGAAPARIVGAATRTVEAPLPPRSAIIGARFRPGMAPALLNLPADAITDAEIALTDAWGDSAGRVAQRVANGHTIADKLGAMQRAVLDRLATAREPDRRVAAAIAWLARHPTGRVADAGDAAGLGPRQLRRRFTAAVGYGPKTFQRVLRLQRLLDRAGRPGGAGDGLAALAAEAGYADQAHMTREVRALSGRTPALLLARAHSTLVMADLFKTAGEAET